MSRIPFWLVILFAMILCVTGGVAVLHRTGFITSGPDVAVAKTQALPPETGIILTGVTRRNPGILVIEGRAQAKTSITVTHGGDVLLAAHTDDEGIFSLPVRMADAGARGWQSLQLQAGTRQAVPLLVGPLGKSNPVAPVLLQSPAGYWQSLTSPGALAIATLRETQTGDWQLTGQHPSGGALLLHIYSDNRLVAVHTTDSTQLFEILLPKAMRPQTDLRIDAYDAKAFSPVVRLVLKLPLDGMFERVTVADQVLWVWRNASAQQADPAEPLPGQVIPVAATPVKAD